MSKKKKRKKTTTVSAPVKKEWKFHFSSGVALTVLFLLSIYAVPVATLFTSKKDVSAYENRRFSSLEGFQFNLHDINEFPKTFENYYNDHFGFREFLTQWYNYIQIKLLRPPTADVIIGKDNWLFYNEKGTYPLQDFLGLRPLALKDITKWDSVFSRIDAICKQKGIKYLIAVSPNKMSVYPEYMPYSQKETRLDVLAHHMKRRSDINFLDLRQPLTKSKKESSKLLYFPLGTHWNDYGAFIAYNEIMKKITEWFPDKVPLTMEDMVFCSRENSSHKIIGGNDNGIAKLLNLESIFHQEDVHFEPKPSYRADKVEVSYPDFYKNYNPKPFAYEKREESIKAVVLHGSFSTYLVPFLSSHFKRIVFARGIMNSWNTIPEWIISEKPDIIIIELTERLL